MVIHPVTAREREMCAVADPGGAHGATPLRTKIFLISCSFSGKIWQICMLAPPPTRNPGSAPGVATYTPVLEFFFLPSWYIITQSSLLNYFKLAQLD